MPFLCHINKVSLCSFQMYNLKRCSVSRSIFFSSGGVVPEPSRGVRGHAPPAEIFLYPLHWNAWIWCTLRGEYALKSYSNSPVYYCRWDYWCCNFPFCGFIYRFLYFCIVIFKQKMPQRKYNLHNLFTDFCLMLKH